MKLINALQKYKELGFNTLFNAEYYPQEVRIDEMINRVKANPKNYAGNFGIGGSSPLSAYIGNSKHFWFVKKYETLKTQEQLGNTFDWLMREVYSGEEFGCETVSGMSFKVAKELQSYLTTEVFWKVFASIYGCEVKPIKAELYFTQDSMGRRVKDLYDIRVIAR